jgi:hypothetical protein
VATHNIHPLRKDFTMIRDLLATVALSVALTAAGAHAGDFKINFGGGQKNFGKQNYGSCHVDTHRVHKLEQHYHKPLTHVTCYYKVCYKKPCWDYTKHKIFDCLSEAKHFAYELESYGLEVRISKVHSPY